MADTGTTPGKEAGQEVEQVKEAWQEVEQVKEAGQKEEVTGKGTEKVSRREAVRGWWAGLALLTALTLVTRLYGIRLGSQVLLLCCSWL